MVEQDTIKLLRECDAGIKMGISAIDRVMGKVSSENLRQLLCDCRTEHERLKCKIRGLLSSYQDEGKEPEAVEKGMSWMMTNIKMAMDGSDAAIAELMTDGCNLGAKSLSRYLNQYKAASERSKDITKKLIELEDKLAMQIRTFL